MKYKGDQKYLLALSASDIDKLFDMAEDKISAFISIRSNGELKGEAFDHYDQASPWQFRVEIIPRAVRIKTFSWRQKHLFGSIDTGWQRGQSIKSIKSIYNNMKRENPGEAPQGLHIDRDTRFGETPKHQDYTDNFGDSGEYVFEWNSGIKASKKLKKRTQ